jgi:hypothetical protein
VAGARRGVETFGIFTKLFSFPGSKYARKSVPRKRGNANGVSRSSIIFPSLSTRNFHSRSRSRGARRRQIITGKWRKTNHQRRAARRKSSALMFVGGANRYIPGRRRRKLSIHSERPSRVGLSARGQRPGSGFRQRGPLIRIIIVITIFHLEFFV